LERHVYISTLADVPFADVHAILRDTPERLFGQPEADPAVAPQTREIELHAGPVAIHDRFTIEFGEFETHPDGHFSRLHLKFHGDRHHLLLPDVDAALDASDAGDDRTELEIAANYSPRLGALGALEDALVGHRAVEDAMTQLVADLRAGLEAIQAHTDTTSTPVEATEPAGIVMDDQRLAAAS
jgi:hypothetical protein